MCLFVKDNTLELPVSPFSVELFQNIREFRKNILQTIKLLIRFSHLLLQREIFLIYFFLKNSQQSGTPQRLLVKWSHLFICVSLKQTCMVENLSQPAKILMSEQIALAAIFYLNVLEWFLLIMCNEHTLSRSTNLSSNHLTLCMLLIMTGRSKTWTWYFY